MPFFIYFLLIELVAFAQTPIAEVRKMKTGKTVTITGIVTGTFGDLSFLQDTTAGIAIYNAGVLRDDSVAVTGKLSKYNGLLEVVTDSIVNLGFARQVQPRVTTIVDIKEGELIRLDNITLTPSGTFFYPQRSGLIIQGPDTLQYWIDEDTDIPGYSIPVQTSITGIVGRFGSKLQLLPRSHEDILNSQFPIPITNDHFTVVNWNVEFFGAPKYGPANDSLQVSNVAYVINNIQPDIVALQEVSNNNAFNTLLNNIPGYEGRCSSRYSYSYDTDDDFPPQKLCFVYKSSTVKVIREKILFRDLFDEHPSDMFSSGRLPYLLEIRASGHRIFLINLHAKSGVDDSDLIRRVSDAAILKDSLDAYYSDKELILLGDFNDDLDESIVARHESPYAGFITDSNYSCITKPLSEAGWHSTISYDDMIDHQVVSSTLADFFVDVSILNVVAMIPRYGSTTSDHLPLISEFNFDIVTAVDDMPKPILYPNPTNNELWFPTNANITVVNSVGNIIIKKEGAHPPISLGEYAPGLYLVVLEDQLFKIVKN